MTVFKLRSSSLLAQRQAPFTRIPAWARTPRLLSPAGRRSSIRSVESDAKTITTDLQQQQQSNGAKATTLPETDTPCREEEQQQCIAVGDSVVCDIPSASSAAEPFEDAVVCETNWEEEGELFQFENLGPAGKYLGLAILVSPFFFWGTSMPVLKAVLPHSTPLLLASIRLLPSGAVLAAWAAASGRTQPTTPIAWAWILAFALVDGAAFQGFLAQGLTETSAGLGSVIIDSQPLTVAVLAALLFGEVLNSVAISGLVLGIVGLLLVEVPQETLESLAGSISSGGISSLDSLGFSSFFDSGTIYMLLAAQSMAVGTVMVRYVTKHCDPIFATGYHMILGGAMLGAAAIIQEPNVLQETAAAFTSQDYFSMTYVSLLGGAASYGIFFYAASHGKGNLTALSSLTFLTPVFAVASSWLALGETLTPVQLTGAAVTIGAVTLINERNDPPKEQAVEKLE